MPTALTTTTAVLCALTLSLSASAQEHVHGGSGHGSEAVGLGSVNFPNTGKATVQKDFVRGVAMLHSFEYDGARAAFGEAQKKDPAFALAYWMQALTHRQELWGTEQLALARATLAKLGPDAASRIAKARSRRERQFGAAVEALFADRPEPERARTWSDSLLSYVKREPDDAEWASFAAVAMMDAMRWLPAPERRRVRDSAAVLAERVFTKYPSHPGGAHFVIHANDDPVNAPRAERAARMYAKIAPASEHALHMPSHIFVQLGLWDDAAESNERAWAASVADANRSGDSSSVSWHILEWLEYAYLEQGRYHAARALIDTAERRLGSHSDTLTGVDSRFALEEMRFMYAQNTGNWEWDPGPNSRGAARSMRGTGREITQMYHNAVTAQMRGAPTTGAIDRMKAYADSITDPINARQAKAWTTQLASILSAKQSAPAAAITTLSEYAKSDTGSPSGPPGRLITAELLGDLLLTDGRGADAAKAFEQSLRMHPGRSAALLGLARARRLAGDSAGAAKAYRDLLANWHNADADLPALAEARAGAKTGS